MKDMPRIFNLIIRKESYPTDIRDVRKKLSMNELIEELKIAVNPSPMIM